MLLVSVIIRQREELPPKQTLLRPTGHETRLQQAKAWLFEAAMEAGELDTAELGFIGVRKKTAQGTESISRRLLFSPSVIYEGIASILLSH
jgi:hypothetical protein